MRIRKKIFKLYQTYLSLLLPYLTSNVIQTINESTSYQVHKTNFRHKKLSSKIS